MRSIFAHLQINDKTTKKLSRNCILNFVNLNNLINIIVNMVLEYIRAPFILIIHYYDIY